MSGVHYEGDHIFSHASHTSYLNLPVCQFQEKKSSNIDPDK